MSYQYDRYLAQHKSNVEAGFRWLQKNLPEITEGSGAEHNIVFAHDQSKTEPDEYYIIHLESGMMVNWYKHLGRTNTCSQKDRTIDDYYEFFRLFKEELDYFERRKR